MVKSFYLSIAKAIVNILKSYFACKQRNSRYEANQASFSF